MAQPPAYVREFNFADYQASNPSEPLPGSHVDAEYNRIKLTTDKIRENLAKIQRDDGALKNQIVTIDSLSPTLVAQLEAMGFDPSIFLPSAGPLSGVYAADVNGLPVFAGDDVGMSFLVAALTGAANKMPYMTSGSAWAMADITSQARQLLDDTSFTAMKTTLSLTPGTDIQAYSALLAALAGLTVSNGQFIRATGSNAFAATNIVGTVSQSGGTPTGALMESGNNANGYYWRFANGMQVCFFVDSTGQDVTTAAGSVFMTTNAANWTFSATFAAVPAVFVTPAGIRWGSSGTVTTSSAPYRSMAHTSSATLMAVYMAAIGRWF